MPLKYLNHVEILYFWIVLYVIYVFYLTIRALIDPKFAEKLSEMNRRERERKARKRAGKYRFGATNGGWPPWCNSDGSPKG